MRSKKLFNFFFLLQKNRQNEASMAKSSSCNRNKRKRLRPSENRNKSPVKPQRIRYITRSVVRKENAKKNLAQMSCTKKEIVTNFEEIKNLSPSPQPCKKRKLSPPEVGDFLPKRTEGEKNQDGTQFGVKNLNSLESTSREPPCLVLHPFDPTKRRSDPNYSSDESDGMSPYENLERDRSGTRNEERRSSRSPRNNDLQRQPERGNEIVPASEPRCTTKEKSLPICDTSHVEPCHNLNAAETEKNQKRAESMDRGDFNDVNLAGTNGLTVEPCIIIQEHYNDPSSVEFSVSDEQEDDDPLNDSTNIIEEAPFCCTLQESDAQSDLTAMGYIFGPRNDFTHLRESCEFSFGISTTLPDDDESDTGEFFELSRNT